MQEDDTENISTDEKSKKGRPKGSKNKRKRGRPKTKKKSYYKAKAKIKIQETDISNVQLPKFELTPLKQYKDKENLIIPETLEAFPTTEKKAPKLTQENLLDANLDEQKLTEKSFLQTAKEINEDPVDPSYYYRGSKHIPVAGAEYAFTPDMVEEIRKCKEDIIYFAENFFYVITLDRGKQKIKLYDAQKRMLLNMVNNRFSANLACRQAGKALALNTPIYTKRGWKTMGDLTTKDRVVGTSGDFIKITHAHEVLYNRNCFKLTFNSGEDIIADEEHQWFVQSQEDSIGSIKTTKELKEQMLAGIKFKIPVCKKFAENVSQDYHFITNIEEYESVPVRCITVDSEDSLYLAGKTFIPTHNSTLLTVFVLWMTNFNSDYRAAIVANKESTAINIFKRIRMAYEQLPNYIKAGVKDYAKTGLTLENDSSIIVSTTTATSIRGDTLNCISGDSVICYKTYSEEIYTLTIQELFDKLPESIIEEENTFAKLNLNGHVLTDRGWSDFFAVKKSLIDCESVIITTEKDKKIKTTLDHLIFFEEKKFKTAKEFKQGEEIFTKDRKEKIKHIEFVKKQKSEWFDIVQTQDKSFLANNIKVHNCICLDEAAFIECLSGEAIINFLQDGKVTSKKMEQLFDEL